MDIHRSEEEQVEAIKNWWKENGASVVIGLVLGIGAIFSVRYWMDYQKTQLQQASMLYVQTLNTQATDKTKSEAMASELAANFSSTPYASLMALNMAKAKAEAQDYTAAANYLNWVLDNSDDEGFQHIARIRLARVFLQQDKLDDAEKLVKGKTASGFDSDYAEIEGDIASARSNTLQAREYYGKAQAGLQDSSPRFQLLQMKMDNLPAVAEK